SQISGKLKDQARGPRRRGTYRSVTRKCIGLTDTGALVFQIASNCCVGSPRAPICMSYTDKAGGNGGSAWAVVAVGSTILRKPKTATSIAAAATETAIMVRARNEAVTGMSVSHEVDNGDYRGLRDEAVMHITKRRFLAVRAYRRLVTSRISRHGQYKLTSCAY